MRELAIDKVGELERISQDLLTDSKNPSISEKDMDSLPEVLNSQITELTRKISIVDKQSVTISQELLSINKQRVKVEMERLRLTDFISKDQDRIYKTQQRILKLDSDQYRPDLPDFLRPLVQFLTSKDDEILLRLKVSKSEARISQRKTRLVKVNEKLSEILIMQNLRLDNSEALRTINDSYRQIRLNLGRIQREILDNLRDQENEAAQNLILKNYLEALDNLKQAGSKFSDSLLKTTKESRDSFDRVLKLRASSDFPDNLNDMVGSLLNLNINVPKSVDKEKEEKDKEEID